MAKKKGNKDERSAETRIEKRRCIHKFTESEINGINENIADLTKKLRKFEDEKKLVSSIVAGTDAEITKAVNLKEAGEEEREMDCPVEYDFAKGQKTVKHPETGEIIETLPIKPEEREQDLPFADKKGKGKEEDPLEEDATPFDDEEGRN